MARAESYEQEVTPSAAVDPVESAHAAGLRHVDDHRPDYDGAPPGRRSVSESVGFLTS